MKLAGKILIVESITRQTMEDATMVSCCDNCGRPIVNIAHVRDTEDGQTYDIGLDCKKTLIDQWVIKDIEKAGEWDAKYRIKDYKSEQRMIEKVLGYDNGKHDFSTERGELLVYDREPSRTFPGVAGVPPGNLVFIQPLAYLYKLGLREFIQAKLLSTHV